ncbi:MAG TPA: ATP-binding protein [Gemmatimonadales bacterium]|jgi:PAS domain S-box-containing protein|nr:ATP-binding protein [Gemmatimonadales bacterium]
MKIDEFAERIAAFRRRVENTAAGQLPAALLEDLLVAAEELGVTEEELRQQNQALEEARDALGEQRRRYHELFNFAPDAYFFTDLSGIVQEANLSASRMLRIDPRFIPGKALASYVAMHDRGRFRSELSKLRSEPAPHDLTLTLLPRDAAPIETAVTLSVARAPQGGAVGLRWLVRDVTAQRRLEAEIRTLNEELEQRVEARTCDLAAAQRLTEELLAREQAARRAAEASAAQSRHVQKLESIGVLAGGIAHDFNNLLHVVLGNADLARNHLPPDSPALETLDEVIRAARRATDLTRQLLAYSGKGAFVLRHLDLSREVREMATLLRTAIARQATLVWELDPDIPAVSADETQIRQILMNLLTNASDALGDNPGTITLRTGTVLVEEPEASGEFVYLEVADTGIGMASETLQRIFDPFFSTKFAGRGLGLAAVMGIVEAHHGLIRIRTAPGEGTAFRVLFPAAHVEADAADTPAFAPNDWRGKGTLLIVEDEEGVRVVAERMLTGLGFQVLAAEDGREALKIVAARAEELAAVLLDLSMPRMGGPETFRRLRAVQPRLPVVLMSGYTEQEVAPQFLEGGPGPVAFLQKPFLPGDLVAVLRHVVETSPSSFQGSS